MPGDDDMTLDEATALEMAGRAATMSRNDPDYYASLEEMERGRNEVANAVERVTLVDRGSRGSHIEVSLVQPRHRPAAMQTAARMSELFEAPLGVDRQHAGPAPGDAGAGRYSQPPRHVHYKDDRSR